MEVKCHIVATVLFASSMAVGAADTCAFGVCRMAECNKVSERIKQTLDLVADPCEDFNAFACGNWGIAPDDIPETTGYYTNMETPNEEAILEAGRALMEGQNVDKSFETDKKMRIMYNSCMDLPRLIKLGAKPMRELVLNPLGGWPVVEGNLWNRKPWVDVMLGGNKLGLEPNYLMQVNTRENPAHRGQNIFNLFGPTFDLPAKDLMEGMQNERVKSYLEYMVKSAVFIGADRSFAEKEMEKVLMFEAELAQLTEAKELNKVEVKNKYTLGDLEALFSKTGLSIKEFLETLHQIEGIGLLNDTDNVNIQGKQYFHQVPDLLTKTDGRTIVNYILWRAVMPKMTSLCDDARAIANEYKKAAKGISKPESLWKQCLKYVGFLDRKHPLSGAASSLYVRKHLKQEDKKAVQAMFPFIRESYMEIVESSPWMNQTSKEEGRSILLEIESSVGAVDELYCKKMVDGLYEDLSTCDHLKNLLEISKFGKRQLYRTIRENITANDWRQNLEGAHLYTSDRHKMIGIAAGNMQGLFFNPNAPQYLNYAGIGLVMAHKMSHRFEEHDEHDSNGEAQYIQSEKESWFTKKEYDNSQCLMDQFSKIPVPEACSYLGGGEQLSEPYFFHDNMRESCKTLNGLRIAYKAYENYIAKNGPEPQLPGLEHYTPQQMFWISFGQISCTRYTKAVFKDFVKRGYVTLNFRAMFLRNSPEFARDFQCPTGSVMNPKKKCIIF